MVSKGPCNGNEEQLLVRNCPQGRTIGCRFYMRGGAFVYILLNITVLVYVFSVPDPLCDKHYREEG